MTSSATDSFYSAKLRLTRADEHLTDLKARIVTFSDEKSYTQIAEPDPDGIHEIHKIRLTKTFPFRWRVLATEVIEHARASLDHATWATAYLHTRNPNLEFGVFPFASDETKIDNRIRGVSKDCPPEIQALLRTFKPYRGGNDLLFVLNDMCNLSKHALVTFMAKAVAAGTIKGTSFRGPIQFLEPFLLDPVKNEIPYMKVLKGSDPQHDFEVTIYPLIDYREFTSEEPATFVLGAMIEEAARVVSEIEAETIKIGLVK
jgi:hypothetical protein